MFKKITSFTLISVFCLVGLQTAFAKSLNDWNSVVNLVNREVAIKTTGGQTTFGQIKSVNAGELVLLLAGKVVLTNQEKTFARSEIKKIWLAELRSEERNTGKGAAIGAGIGGVIGIIPIISAGKNGTGDGIEFLAVPIFAAFGAGIGALAGFFSKKGHKKRDLIYQM